MTNTWILVANNTRARLFDLDHNTGPLNEIHTLAHPESILDQNSPKNSISNSNNIDKKINIETKEKSDHKQQHAIEFAVHICHLLNKARVDNEYSQLILIATSAFITLLHEHLNSDTQKLIIHELHKNINQLDPEEIRKHLPDNF